MNTDKKIINSKGGLLNLADMLGSVSEPCKVMGYSRDSVYQLKELLKRVASWLKNRAEPSSDVICFRTATTPVACILMTLKRNFPIAPKKN